MNPSVTYPRLRSRAETLAWHYANKSPHFDHLYAIAGVGLTTVESWPRAEVEEFLASVEANWPLIKNPEMTWGQGTQRVVIAYHALKAKLS